MSDTAENTVATEKPNDVATTTTEGSTAEPSQTGESLSLLDTSDLHKEGEPSQTDENKGESDNKDKGSEASDVPEKYEFKEVEGIEIHKDVLDAFAIEARELGLSQEKAQGVVDKMARAMEAASQAKLQELKKVWIQETTTDPELGGANLQVNLGYAKKVLDSFGNPRLVALLNKTGLGNQRDMVEFFVKAGKALSADGFVTGGRSSTKPSSGDDWQDRGNRMFNNTNYNK